MQSGTILDHLPVPRSLLHIVLYWTSLSGLQRSEFKDRGSVGAQGDVQRSEGGAGSGVVRHERTSGRIRKPDLTRNIHPGVNKILLSDAVVICSPLTAMTRVRVLAAAWV